MKTDKLLPVMAIVAVAATALILPATAAADDHRQVRSYSAHPQNTTSYRVHEVERHSQWRVDERRRWEPPRHHHGHGHHHPRPNVVYAPVVRQQYRYQEYRPVERYRSLPGDGLRVSIVYDLNL